MNLGRSRWVAGDHDAVVLGKVRGNQSEQILLGFGERGTLGIAAVSRFSMMFFAPIIHASTTLGG